MSVAERTTSAFSHPTSWHAIDWNYCHQRVQRLQVRIAKATEGKQWRKLKSLQRMLTRSFSAKAIAVKRVTENTGKRTPGVDGITWDTPEGKGNAIAQLKRTGYQLKPLRRVYIPKANGKATPSRHCDNAGQSYAGTLPSCYGKLSALIDCGGIALGDPA